MTKPIARKLLTFSPGHFVIVIGIAILLVTLTARTSAQSGISTTQVFTSPDAPAATPTPASTPTTPATTPLLTSPETAAASAPATTPHSSIVTTNPVITSDLPKPKGPRPTGPVDAKSCTTPECHIEVKQYKVVHGPVNVNACDACHKISDPAKHTYILTRPPTEMCTFCHKMDLKSQPYVHQPVSTGNCLPCHNPHGGKTTKFMRGNTMRDTCNACHKDVVAARKNVHGPVAAGACEACHSPHMAKNPKLLVAPAKELCIACHKEMGDQLKKAKVTHKPVMEGDCSQCHDPHASDFKMQVKAAPADLCTSCHEHDKIKNAAMNSQFKHGVVTKDQACLTCHTAHGGPLTKLMKAPPAEICLKCHKDDQKTADGRAVPSVANIGDPKLSRHGPVREGSCNGCHAVHGSDTSRLLAKAYPESFYTKYDPDNFALCFSCHDKKLIETKEAEGLTGFRNGTKNLHFVHVDREKGRTCRACHETHASKNPVQIRDSVPYGQWEMPINFTKTANGGSCSPGCHKEYGYDRKTPVENPTPNAPPSTGGPVNTAPATAPAPASPAETPFNFGTKEAKP